MTYGQEMENVHADRSKNIMSPSNYGEDIVNIR